MKMTTAFIGTGLIGAGLALAAAERGHSVKVWNRTAKKARDVAASMPDRAIIADDDIRATVRGASHIHIALSDDDAVDAVIAQFVNDTSADIGDAVIIDHSTTSPAGTKARAARLADKGVAFVHAPVFMSPAMCRKGGGLMLLSGPDDARTKAQPALMQMTGKIVDYGARTDLAACMKLMGNAMIFAITAGLSDVFAIARSNNIEPSFARALFDTFQPAGTLVYRGQKMADGDFTPSFEMTMAKKDAQLMVNAVVDEDTLIILPAILRAMEKRIEGGDGALDVGALAKSALALSAR